MLDSATPYSSLKKSGIQADRANAILKNKERKSSKKVKNHQRVGIEPSRTKKPQPEANMLAKNAHNCRVVSKIFHGIFFLTDKRCVARFTDEAALDDEDESELPPACTFDAIGV